MGVVANKIVYDIASKIARKIRRKRKTENMEEMEIKIYNEFVSEAKLVREEVFMAEQGFSYDYDEMDDVAIHFVMFKKGLAVAACRVFESEQKMTYILGRLAVKKEYRGKGFGRMMIEAAKEYVKSVDGDSLILHSQLQAKDFYTKNGFCEYGEIEYEEDCPHIWMKAAI